ncbi:MAG: hypothetical protein L7F77_12580, partial [Candidatus Magnetominusculus sp. LBB02]|nr:hypothetical protein [Candidatus Magnetominusculus sp. LBB02]
MLFIIGALAMATALVTAALLSTSSKGKLAKVSASSDVLTATRDAIIGYAQKGSLPPDLTLNNTRTIPVDSYGQPILYIYDSTLTTNICSQTTTGLSLSTGTTNVAFILFSGGANAKVDSKVGAATITASGAQSGV